MLRAAGVPTAETLSVARAPCVLKADGLAAGKGVFVCHTREQLDAALPAVEALGQGVVIEELLEGYEVSLFALCDGRRVVPLGSAQDFKRAEDGDAGPNTGGMGAYSPVAEFDGGALVSEIHEPVLEELARRGAPFIGCLFAGLMITADGPRVLEFNARFGDPETQVLMPRISGDLLGALSAAASGDLSGTDLTLDDRAAVTVVLTNPDYPSAKRLSGRADHRARGRRQNRRARLPGRHCGAGRARDHAWRQNPLGDRDRRHDPSRARPRVRGGRPRLVRRRPLQARHRRGGR